MMHGKDQAAWSSGTTWLLNMSGHNMLWICMHICCVLFDCDTVLVAEAIQKLLASYDSMLKISRGFWNPPPYAPETSEYYNR